MLLIERLLALQGPLVGTGVNHEGEHFTGRLEVVSLVAGQAALLHYTATGTSGVHFHTESCLLAATPEGSLCLWPVMEELPFVMPHVQKAVEELPTHVQVVFATGPRDDRQTFREEITLRVSAEGLVLYAHAWGMPGGNFGERSSCMLHPPGG